MTSFPLNNLTSFLVPPDMRALLNSHLTEMLCTINCHQVGVVQSFDVDKQTATVLLVLQRAVYNNPPDGTVVEVQPTVVPYPTLVDVPCVVLGGGSASLQFPISAGDECLVLFNDRDLDPWFTFGTNPGLPNSLRTHSLSDGVALVGIRSSQSALENYDPARARLVLGDSQFAVGDKFRMKNAATDLRTAMDSLFTALTGWVNTGGSTPNPATVAALAAVKATFDSLLET